MELCGAQHIEVLDCLWNTTRGSGQKRDLSPFRNGIEFEEFEANNFSGVRIDVGKKQARAWPFFPNSLAPV